MVVRDAAGKELAGGIKIDFFDNQVDAATDTVMIQLLCPNADNAIVPGGFVKIDFTQKFDTPQLAIPTTAVMNEGKDLYVYVVGLDNDGGMPSRLVRQFGDDGMEQGIAVVNREFHIAFCVGDGQEKPWFRDNQFKRNVVTWETWLFIRGDDVIDVDVPPAATMAIDDFEANAFAFQFMDIPKIRT